MRPILVLIFALLSQCKERSNSESPTLTKPISGLMNLKKPKKIRTNTLVDTQSETTAEPNIDTESSKSATSIVDDSIELAAQSTNPTTPFSRKKVLRFFDSDIRSSTQNSLRDLVQKKWQIFVPENESLARLYSRINSTSNGRVDPKIEAYYEEILKAWWTDSCLIFPLTQDRFLIGTSYTDSVGSLGYTQMSFSEIKTQQELDKDLDKICVSQNDYFLILSFLSKDTYEFNKAVDKTDGFTIPAISQVYRVMALADTSNAAKMRELNTAKFLDIHFWQDLPSNFSDVTRQSIQSLALQNILDPFFFEFAIEVHPWKEVYPDLPERKSPVSIMLMSRPLEDKDGSSPEKRMSVAPFKDGNFAVELEESVE